MAKTIQAKVLSQVQYSFQDTINNQTRSDADATQNAAEYTYGTGNLQVNGIVRSTGVLASGGSTVLDLQSLSIDVFGATQVVSFDNVKTLLISNTATTLGYDMSIQATGVGGATGFYNGGSGNNIVKPYSSFMYNDPYTGVDVTTNNTIHLHDVGGSGTSYSYTVMGILT